MTFAEFTETSRKREVRKLGTAYPFEPWYYALGLTGDVGELADKLKRVYRDSKGDFSSLSRQDLDILIYELGDVLWYVNAIAVKLGRSLEDIARMNGEKHDELERRA